MEEPSAYLPISQVMLGIQGKKMNFMSGIDPYVILLLNHLSITLKWGHSGLSYISGHALLCFLCN